MYLLDTVVLSELRKKDRNSGVSRWIMDKSDEDLYISALSIGEIRRGIYLQEQKDPDFAKRLFGWLKNLPILYGNRVLPVTPQVALEWGIISAKTGNSGIDNLIAATAKIYNLVIVTRNTKHFEPTEVECINPWA